jgi:hypothetical protein
MFCFFIEHREGWNYPHVVFDCHLLVFQTIHHKHEWRFSVCLDKLPDHITVVNQFALDLWHHCLSLGVRRAVTTEWETRDEAVDPGFGLVEADFLECVNVTVGL